MKTMTRIMVIVAVMALVSVGGVGIVNAQEITAPVDHYKCYLIRPSQTVNFPNAVLPKPLELKDQFEDEQVRKLISRLICAPVSKENSPINNPDIHLKAYQIIPSKPLKQPRPKVELNSLNPHLPQETVEVLKPVFLLVPTTKRCLNDDPTTPGCP